MIGLTQGMIERCIREITRKSGVVLSSDQAKSLIETDQELVDALIELYPDRPGNEDGGLDTYERDWLFDNFAKYVGQDHWPMFGDDPEYQKQFVDAVCQAVKDGKIERFADDKSGS